MKTKGPPDAYGKDRHGSGRFAVRVTAKTLETLWTQLSVDSFSFGRHYADSDGYRQMASELVERPTITFGNVGFRVIDRWTKGDTVLRATQWVSVTN